MAEFERFHLARCGRAWHDDFALSVFWQASQEAEDQREQPRREKLTEAPEQAPAAFERIRLDTWIGMALSNLVALAIMLTAGATLARGRKDRHRQFANGRRGLRPIAGEFAYLIFALGIIGTGLMAVPVLAGSAAYAIGEALRWPVGLARRPKEARAFYATLAVATVAGWPLTFCRSIRCGRCSGAPSSMASWWRRSSW